MDKDTSQLTPADSDDDGTERGADASVSDDSPQPDHRPPPPSQFAYQPRPPAPRDYSSAQTPAPSYQQQPPQQTPPGRPQYQQGPPQQTPQFQQHPPQSSHVQYQQHPPQHHQFQPQPAPAASQPAGRSNWLIVAVAAAFLLIPLGVGAWYVMRDDNAIVAGSWPSDPELKYSFTAAVSGDDFERVPVAGTPDSFYIAEVNGETSKVTRYVEGEAEWAAEVGLAEPSTLQLDDDVLLMQSTNDDYTESQLVRLDIDDGDVAWTVKGDGILNYRLDGDRLFVIVYAYGEQGEDEGAKLFEYDLESGTELNRLAGREFTFTEGGFVSLDGIESTAQLLDLDFKPVGDPVDLEPSGVLFTPFVFSPTDDGWIYYSDRRTFGGETSVVGVSTSGKQTFECSVNIEEPNNIFMHDETTLVLSSYNSIEVFDVDGTTCSSRWHTDSAERVGIRSYGPYPVRQTYIGVGEDIDYLLNDSDLEVLDWDSGDVIATGENDWVLNDEGQMITFKENILVAKQIDNGDELWQIAAPPRSEVRALDGTIVLTTKGRKTTTIDVYAD